MRIKDLPAPVTSSKVTFVLSTTWMGFTPANDSEKAREKKRDETKHRISGGYTIEYIAPRLQKPNDAFKESERYSKYRKAHRENKGRFVAVHKLSTISHRLEEIMNQEEFEDLQDVWSEEGKRYRWSVTFPIVESYEIVGKPKALDILDNLDVYRGNSGRMRVFDSDHRKKIDNLEIIKKLPTPNDLIFMNKTIKKDVNRHIEEDLTVLPEGMTKERMQKVRQRATRLAEKFVSKKRKSGNLVCDLCQFDPLAAVNQTSINSEGARLRFLLDVHHKYPLAEGGRQTTIEDFALLCPNCHRMEHLLLKHGHSQF